MHLSIQFLKKDDNVQKALREDGWRLESNEGAEDVYAQHPDVHQETEARRRLHDLGLLTCRICRIEFRN